MSLPQNQHYISKVYLKHFSIDENANSNFVYCYNFEDPYRKNIQKVGINHSIFKMRNFYSDKGFEDPFAIEKIFASDIEPLYNKIMHEINLKKNLENDLRMEIILWMWFSQLKSPVWRENHQRLLNFMMESSWAMRQQREITNEEKNIIGQKAKKDAKEIHLDDFTKEDLYKIFFEGLSTKRWRIIMPPEGYVFWTNDNPGFSPNLHPLFRRDNPFHFWFEINANSFCYFVLSPNYCIEFSPFFIGDPLEMNGINMEIKYEFSSLIEYDFIQRGIFETRYKLIISNSKETLDRQIKHKR